MLEAEADLLFFLAIFLLALGCTVSWSSFLVAEMLLEMFGSVAKNFVFVKKPELTV